MMIKYLLVLLSQALLLSILILSLLISDSLSPSLPITEAEENIAFCGVNSGKYTGEEIVLGKAIFKANCAMCHNKNMRDDLTGPALGGVTERWKDYPKEDLYRWIRNSTAMIEEGHERAVKIWEEWDRDVMNSFPNLTDEDIENVLAYIEY